jgi:hypothetical protein
LEPADHSFFLKNINITQSAKSIYAFILTYKIEYHIGCFEKLEKKILKVFFWKNFEKNLITDHHLGHQFFFKEIYSLNLLSTNFSPSCIVNLRFNIKKMIMRLIIIKEKNQ